MTLTVAGGTLRAKGGPVSEVQQSILARSSADGGPVAYWDAREHDGGSILKDLASNRHHLQMGSTHVAAIVPAPHERMGLLLSGTTGRYASAPDRAEYDITGDIDLIWYGSLNDWAPGTSFQTLISKWDAGTYLLRIDNGGRPTLNVYAVTSGDVSIGCNASVPFAKGASGWVRCTRRQSDGRVQFFTSNDGEVWTQLGVNATLAAGQAIVATTDRIEVGGFATGAQPMAGFVYRAIVKNGIDGPAVFDADFTRQAEGATSFTESALGATVTINGTTGADTNDPLWLGLAENEDPYLYLPGSTGNAALTPHKSEFAFTDVDLRWFGTIGAATDRVLIAKTQFSGNQRSFQWYVAGNNKPNFVISTDGANEIAVQADAVVPRNEILGLRVTRRQSDGQVVFYRAADPSNPDGTAWNQVSTTTLAGTMFQTTQPLEVGARASSTNMNHEGKVYRAQVYSGIGSAATLVADFDPSLSRQPHRNFVDSVGNVWTINRSTSGRKAALVDQPLFLFGTDDYMEAPDHDDLDFDAGQDFTVVAAFREHRQPESVAFFAKKSDFASATGWQLIYASSTDTLEARMSGTVDAIVLAPRTRLASLGNVSVLAARREGTVANTLHNTKAGSNTNVSADVRSSSPVNVGKISSAGTSADMEFIGAAIFRRALSDTEIEEVSREFGWTPKASLLDEAVVAAVPGVIDDGVGMIDLTGRGHNFKLGSTTGADTNDPTMLPYDGEKYAYLPGVAENYLGSPNTHAFDSGATFDLRAKVSLDDWTPSDYASFLTQRTATASGHWGFRVNNGNTGILHLYWHDGGDFIIASSTSPVPFTNGQVGWVRATREISGGTYTVKFYTRLGDEDPWTQLGSDVVGASAAPATLASVSLNAGLYGSSGNMMIGRFYRGELRNAIDGPMIEVVDVADATEPYADVSSGGSIAWTFHRSATGKKLAVVDQNLLLFGTDDYAETPDDDELDFGASDSFTALILTRGFSNVDGETFLAKRATSGSGAAGWVLRMSTGNRPILVVSDGTNHPGGFGVTKSDGLRQALSGMRDVSADTVATYVGESYSSAADGTTGTITNSQALRIGRLSGTSTSYLNGEIMGVAIIRRALTAAELTTLANELIAANADRTKRVLSRRPSARKRSPYLMEVV